MRKPLGGAFEKPREKEKILGPLQHIAGQTRHYKEDEEVDYCIVGLVSMRGRSGTESAIG